MQALFGHIDPAMLKRYSHTRRRALEEAANALQPTFIMPVNIVNTLEHIEQVNTVNRVNAEVIH